MTDIVVIRTGEKLSTKYSVMPVQPFAPLTDEQKALEKYDTAKLKPMFTKEQIEKLMNGATIEEVTEEKKDDNVDVDFTQQVG